MKTFRIVLECTLDEDQCEELDNILDDNSVAPTRYEVMEVKPEEPEESFNPHGNTTVDGVLITRGLKVRDYNRDVTVVVADRDCQDWKCCGSHARKNDLVTDLDAVAYDCNSSCCHDHWYTLENGAMMNGSRMQSIR